MQIIWWMLGRLLLLAIVLPILAALGFILVSSQGATVVTEAVSRYLEVNPEADVFGIRRALPALPAEAPRAPTIATRTQAAARVVDASVWHATSTRAGQTTVTFANDSPTDGWSDCTVTLAGGYRVGPFRLSPLGRAEFALTSFHTTGGQTLSASTGAALTAGTLPMRCLAADGRPVTISVR